MSCVEKRLTDRNKLCFLRILECCEKGFSDELASFLLFTYQDSTSSSSNQLSGNFNLTQQLPIFLVRPGRSKMLDISLCCLFLTCKIINKSSIVPEWKKAIGCESPPHLSSPQAMAMSIYFYFFPMTMASFVQLA